MKEKVQHIYLLVVIYFFVPKGARQVWLGHLSCEHNHTVTNPEEDSENWCLRLEFVRRSRHIMHVCMWRFRNIRGHKGDQREQVPASSRRSSTRQAISDRWVPVVVFVELMALYHPSLFVSPEGAPSCRFRFRFMQYVEEATRIGFLGTFEGPKCPSKDRRAGWWYIPHRIIQRGQREGRLRFGSPHTASWRGGPTCSCRQMA